MKLSIIGGGGVRVPLLTHGLISRGLPIDRVALFDVDRQRLAMMAGLALLVYRTRLGTAMRATAQNPQVARLMGVDVNRVIAATFIIGAALGAVAAKRTDKRLQDALRDASRVAALEAGVVVDADPGEHRDFLPAKPWNAAVVAVDGQTHLVRRDLGSPGGQELADLAPGVHGHEGSSARPTLGGPVSTWIKRDSHSASSRAYLEER